MAHKCATNLFCDVRLPRRIVLRCVDALGSTGFSPPAGRAGLCGVSCGELTVHRLKPVLLDRAGFAPSLLVVKAGENFDEVLV
jgi:hypothetical protein